MYVNKARFEVVADHGSDLNSLSERLVQTKIHELFAQPSKLSASEMQLAGEEGELGDDHHLSRSEQLAQELRRELSTEQPPLDVAKAVLTDYVRWREQQERAWEAEQRDECRTEMEKLAKQAKVSYY